MQERTEFPLPGKKKSTYEEIIWELLLFWKPANAAGCIFFMFLHLGKKKSKFKSFKKFFVKKKRKESSSGSSNLKLFQSTSDVAASHDMHASFDSEDEHE